ncbi:MAG: efflux RND transporter permease subunit [Gemmatimonadota bacterium]
MSVTGLVQRYRAAVSLALVMVLAAGAYALATLPSGAYPEAVFPRVAVVVRGGTFEPRDMVVAVTRPLEEALIGVIDLRRVRSRTVRGGAEMSLDFRPGADMPLALQQVQGRIATIQGTLPAGLEIQAERLTPSVFPMMQYELTGADPVLLRDLAQFTIRPRLARLADVGTVEVQGGLVREVAVVLDPHRLVTERVNATEVADAIRRANVVEAAGRVDRDYLQYSIMVSGLAESPAAVGQIVVRRSGDRLVRVADLGTVTFGVEDVFQLATGNGKQAALVNISRQPAGNTVRVERAVEAAMAAVRPLLPASVTLDLVYNQGAIVRDSLASVRDAMLIGSVLAIIMLLLFLKRIDLALITGAAIPLTLLGTFGGIALFGDTLNLFSLGGLAVAIGLVIDDAVVVVENLERHLRDPALAAGGVDAIRAATDEILAPVAGSTLTTVVVFLPLGLLEGVVGQFFRSFSIALSTAVLLSLAVAISVIPLLVATRIKALTKPHPSSEGRWFEALARRYRSTLESLIGHPRRAGLVALGVLVALVLLGRSVETGFLPEMDEGGFILDYWTKTGTSLAETDRELRQVEQILRSDSAVQAFTRRTGSELGFFATAPNRGDMTVLLKPRGKRDASVFEVISRLRPRIETVLPAMRIEFVLILQDLIGDLTGSPEPVEIKLFHPELRTAQAAAKAVADAIEPVHGLVDLFDGNPGDLSSLWVDLDPAQASRIGLTAEETVSQARASLFGMDAGTIREPDRLIPIRVRLTDSTRLRPDIAATLPVVGPAGWAPLGTLGRVEERQDPSELTRENLRPVVRVTGSVDRTQASLGSVMAEVRSRASKVALPPGVTLELGGQYASQQASFQQFILVFLLASAAVLLVMVAQFRSFRGPLVIMGAAMLGVTGALGALIVTGVPFNVSSFMGLILLVGLVVKNGIILLDAADGFRDRGLEPKQALLEAGRIRLRPILMTTICTLAGLVPLALGLGAGAELQRPLAIAVIGGLTVSTGITLLLLPVALTVVGAVPRERRPAPQQ